MKNLIKLKVLGNEKGGIEVMLISLIALLFCTLLFTVSLDYILLSKDQNKLKNDLNRAVHAASLSIDKQQLSVGYLKLDTTTPGTRAQDMFYRYLRSNIGLDITNKGIKNSIIGRGTQLTINELVYVNWESRVIENLNSSPSSCVLDVSSIKVSCTVTLNQGTDNQISRVVNQSVIGPSIVAVISAEHKGIGLISDEPLLIPAVQEVIFRK
ncbi:hypothetical protein AB4Z50_14675 [Paenibacillus sp. 2TAB26]|uniref:hypothetical protein n=1 Tax=Paenibacillus sp. 2TAB26 TaxID=3233005 RepID=UPI003F95DDF8